MNNESIYDTDGDTLSHRDICTGVVMYIVLIMDHTGQCSNTDERYQCDT